MSFPAYASLAFDPDLTFPRWRVYMRLVHQPILNPVTSVAVDVSTLTNATQLDFEAVSEALGWLTARGYVIETERHDGIPSLVLAWTIEKADEEQQTAPELLIRGRQYGATRRARKLANGGIFGPADVSRMLNEQGMRCYYCAAPLSAGFHIDHRTPLARGGSNGPENLCVACPTCNCRKGAKTEAEFRSGTA